MSSQPVGLDGQPYDKRIVPRELLRIGATLIFSHKQPLVPRCGANSTALTGRSMRAVLRHGNQTEGV
jgi:hypothetical protein